MNARKSTLVPLPDEPDYLGFLFGLKLDRFEDLKEAAPVLKKASVLCGVLQELESKPEAGLERAVKVTVKRFSLFHRCSVRSVWRWIGKLRHGGLDALRDGRPGRSGGRAKQLHKILK